MFLEFPYTAGHHQLTCGFWLQGGVDPSEPTGAVASEQAGDSRKFVIWGTDVVVDEAKDKFQKFVLGFIDPDADETEGIDPNRPLYMQKLEEVGNSN